MSIVSYEKIARLLKLDEREKEIDSLLVESANENICYLCDREFSLQEYGETVLCENGVLRMRQWPIQSIKSMVLANGTILDVALDFTQNAIVVSEVYNGTYIEVHYVAGYEEKDMPSSLVQAVVTTFLDRKREIALKQQGGYPEKQIVSSYDDIMHLLEPYTRKRL